MGKLSRATISREKSWFASPCMGWIMIGSFDRLCGWYLGMAYGRESHIDAPSHEISYNTTNPSHTQMLVPRQIPPFYGSMIIIIDWIWLWDPTSIPFPEKGIHIVCSPLLWLRAFSFFFYGWDLELFFFWNPHDISVYPHVFCSKPLNSLKPTCWNSKARLISQFVCYIPMISLDPPWDPVHHEEQEQPLDFVAQSYGTPTAWVLHLVPRLRCLAAAMLLWRGSNVVRAGCGLEGCDNGCRDTYTTPKQIGLPIQWPLFIWIDSYPSKTVTCENFMLTVRSFHTTMVKHDF